jgi:HPr kinase/phosphorylase
MAAIPLGSGDWGSGRGGRLNLHASCVVIGEAGVLIRGASGSGKSSLARALVSRVCEGRGFAAFVADDRVLVASRGGRLVASPHPAIAGRYEARGLGILEEPHEPCAIIRLVVDFQPSVARLPGADELVAHIAGVAVQRLPLVAGRAGLYETSLVLHLIRTPLESESHLTTTFRVGGAGI